MAQPAVDFSGLSDKIKNYTVREAASLLTTILITNQSFLAYMALYPDVTDQLALTQMFVSSVLQPGGKDTFDPKGTVKFKSRVGQVRECKIDYSLTPTMINAMWKGYLGRIATSTRESVYDVPFQNEIMDKLSSKAKEEMHLDAVFKGVYNADKKLANRVFNGILPLMAQAGVLAASQIFAGAAITQSNAIDQFEGVADLVPAHLLNQDLVMLCEPTAAKFYNRDYRGTFGQNVSNTGPFEHQKIDGTNITIVPEPGLSGTGALICTLRNNFVWLTGPLGGTPGAAFDVEKRQRNIDIMADFQAAPDFAIAEYIWTNQAALDSGAALIAAEKNEPA